MKRFVLPCCRDVVLRAGFEPASLTLSKNSRGQHTLGGMRLDRAILGSISFYRSPRSPEQIDLRRHTVF